MSLFFPKDQPNRLTRLKRFYMGVASYAMSAVVFAVLLNLKPALLTALDMLPLLLGNVARAHQSWVARKGLPGMGSPFHET